MDTLGNVMLDVLPLAAIGLAALIVFIGLLAWLFDVPCEEGSRLVGAPYGGCLNTSGWAKDVPVTMGGPGVIDAPHQFHAGGFVQRDDGVRGMVVEARTLDADIRLETGDIVRVDQGDPAFRKDPIPLSIW